MFRETLDMCSNWNGRHTPSHLQSSLLIRLGWSNESNYSDKSNLHEGVMDRGPMMIDGFSSSSKTNLWNNEERSAPSLSLPIKTRPTRYLIVHLRM
jgi:hypothetical protein